MVQQASEGVRQAASIVDATLDVRVRVACDGGGLTEVTTVSLPTGTTADSFSTIVRDLGNAGHVQSGENILVYLEGNVGAATGQAAHPYDSSPSWGNAANAGGRVAIVYRNSNMLWTTALHELSHTIGAVDSGAPHTTLAGHCVDGLDVMCYRDGGPRSGYYSDASCAVAAYDCGGDDYFAVAPAPGSWLDSHFNLARGYNQFFHHSRSGDAIAPTLSVQAPATDGARTATVTFSGGDDVGVDRVEVFVDGVLDSTLGVLPAVVRLDQVSAGTHLVEAEVVDTSGNRSTRASRTVIVDADGPTLDLGTLAPTAGDTFEVMPAATDPAGVQEVRIYLTSTTFVRDYTAPYEFKVSVSTLTPGPRSFTVKAFDILGNASTATASTVISRGTGLAAGWFDDPARAAFKGTSSGVGPINFSWSTGSPGYGIVADTWSARFVGRLRIPTGREVGLRLTADDHASVRVDGTEVAVVSGSGLQTAYDTPRTYVPGSMHDIEVEYDDVDSVATLRLEWRFGTGAWTPVPKMHMFPETSAPTATITSPTGGAVVAETTSIEADGVDNVGVARMSFSIDGRVVGADVTPPFSWDWNTTSFARGSHVIRVVATDASGNASAPVEHSVTVDNGRGLVGTYFDDAALTVPRLHRVDRVVSMATSGAPATGMGAETWTVRWQGEIRAPSAGAPTLHVTHDDGVRIWIDGTLALDMWASTGLTTSTVPLGGAAGQRHQLLIEYVDQAGAATMSLKWAIGVSTPVVVPTLNLYPETDAPAVSLTSPGAGVQVTGPTPLTATASDAVALKRVEFLVDSTLVGTDNVAPFAATWSPTATLNGPHTITARAVDVAGNIATSTAAIVTVDIGTGLRGACWNAEDLTTSPAGGEVLKSALMASWTTNVPCPGMTSVDHWSQRYRGWIRQPSPGTWSLYVGADDGLRVLVDGVVVVDELAYAGVSREHRIDLPAGAVDRRVEIAIEHVERTGASNLSLQWQVAGGAKVKVPTSSLYPATSAAT